METQSGYVTIDGSELGATLSMENDRLKLVVTNQSGSMHAIGLRRIELLQFRGSRNVFTLLTLTQVNSSVRLGVGSTSTYLVALAIEDVLFDDIGEIASRNWLLYVEDLAKIAHVTGLEETMAVDTDGRVCLTFVFVPAPAVPLHCPNTGLTVHLGQDANKTGDAISGPKLSFRYSARIEFAEARGLYDTLNLFNRVRLFFSLLMGRVLGTDEVSIRLEEGDSVHDAKIYGLLPTSRHPNPVHRLVDIENNIDLAALLDRWLTQYEVVADAIHLHMDGLEQRKLPLQLRFQIFVQALEALHRRAENNNDGQIDVEAVTAALRQQGIAGDVLDRVAGVLAHAHEPGLRQRLKHYWSLFRDELAVLRPELSRNSFVNRVVATRNHFAHRTDRDAQVLDRAGLWDATETVKAISHMALVQRVGGNVVGLGQAMLSRDFVEYIVDEG